MPASKYWPATQPVVHCAAARCANSANANSSVEASNRAKRDAADAPLSRARPRARGGVGGAMVTAASDFAAPGLKLGASRLFVDRGGRLGALAMAAAAPRWKVGDKVMALYEDDNWYRAEVLGVDVAEGQTVYLIGASRAAHAFARTLARSRA